MIEDNDPDAIEDMFRTIMNKAGDLETTVDALAAASQAFGFLREYTLARLEREGIELADEIREYVERHMRRGAEDSKAARATADTEDRKNAN